MKFGWRLFMVVPPQPVIWGWTLSAILLSIWLALRFGMAPTYQYTPPPQQSFGSSGDSPEAQSYWSIHRNKQKRNAWRVIAMNMLLMVLYYLFHSFHFWNIYLFNSLI
jgi:hypothetical protein